MTAIAHLSDLHFGRDRPELLRPLIAAVNALRPDLVVVSGDFTQRARASQFRAARAFLDRLTAPWLAVPGNHDVPLDRPVTRLLRPYGRYRRWIDADLAPSWRGGDVAVIGLNTVNPLDWQRGRLSRSRIARMADGLREPASLRIVVAHHPVVHLGAERKALMRGADAALGALAEGAADVVLSGHLHSWKAEAFTTGGRAIVMAQAGTGLSSRLRGEENDFNLLRCDGDRIDLRRFAAADRGVDFEEVSRTLFRRGEAGWRRDATAGASQPIRQDATA
jgi:3',5'-cyclic AMP phosphodiesterase CpdA